MVELHVVTIGGEFGRKLLPKGNPQTQNESALKKVGFWLQRIQANINERKGSPLQAGMGSSILVLHLLEHRCGERGSYNRYD